MVCESGWSWSWEKLCCVGRLGGRNADIIGSQRMPRSGIGPPSSGPLSFKNIRIFECARDHIIRIPLVRVRARAQSQSRSSPRFACARRRTAPAPLAPPSPLSPPLRAPLSSYTNRPTPIPLPRLHHHPAPNHLLLLPFSPSSPPAAHVPPPRPQSPRSRPHAPLQPNRTVPPRRTACTPLLSSFPPRSPHAPRPAFVALLSSASPSRSFPVVAACDAHGEHPRAHIPTPLAAMDKRYVCSHRLLLFLRIPCPCPRLRAAAGATRKYCLRNVVFSRIDLDPPPCPQSTACSCTTLCRMTVLYSIPADS